MKESLIVIGAGTAGLAAGCYAAMNGFDVSVFEMAAQPGGLCTSWHRQGYRFDASVAGLAGTGPSSPLYRMWQELGVIARCPLYDGTHFGRVCHPDGRRFTIYTNVDRLEHEFATCFPKDARALRELTDGIRRLLAVDPPLAGTPGFEGIYSMLRTSLAAFARLPTLIQFANTSIRQFASRFEDPFLVAVLNNLVHFGGSDVPLLTVMLPIAYSHRKMAGIPLHGWLSFAKALERRLNELGGVVHSNAKVTGLEIDSHHVRGIVLEDGSRHRADRVLSAADGRFTQQILLGRDELGLRGFEVHRVSDQPVQVDLGVALDLAQDDGPVTFLLRNPFEAGGRVHERITAHNRCQDPAASPPGKSSVTVFLDSDYDFWRSASQQGRYAEEKRLAGARVIAAIESHRPGFAEQVELVEVATPMTRERYTGNWLGAMQAMKAESSLLRSLVSGGPRYRDPTVKGFYMAGQWVETWGGITTAAQSARKAIGVMCQDMGRKFTTTLAPGA